MIPKIASSERRLRLAGLAALTACEAGCLALGGFALRLLIDAVETGNGLWLGGGLVAVAGVVGVAAAWTRSVLAEDISMGYANELRALLMTHSVVSAGARRRLGQLAVRMTGDMTPMRDWVATGLTDSGSALASIAAGLSILVLAAGAAGGAAALALLMLCVLVAVFALGPLERALIVLRKERGRVSAMAGDVVLGAESVARFGALGRELKRFDRRTTRLRRAALARRMSASWLEAPGGLAVTVVVLAAVVAASLGMSHAARGPDWALLAVAAGMLATAVRTGGRAMDAFLAFKIARIRVVRLANDIAASKVQSGAAEVQAHDPAGSIVAHFAGEQIELSQGQVMLVRAASLTVALEAVSAVRIEGAASILCAPSAPLIRGSVQRNLSLGDRRITPERMTQAIEDVGLDGGAWPLDRRLDPAVGDPDPVSEALLRIARAGTHHAQVIVVAEPVLAHAPDVPERLERIAVSWGVSVVAVSWGAAGPLRSVLDLKPEAP